MLGSLINEEIANIFAKIFQKDVETMSRNIFSRMIIVLSAQLSADPPPPRENTNTLWCDPMPTDILYFTHMRRVKQFYPHEVRAFQWLFSLLSTQEGHAQP